MQQRVGTLITSERLTDVLLQSFQLCVSRDSVIPSHHCFHPRFFLSYFLIRCCLCCHPCIIIAFTRRESCIHNVAGHLTKRILLLSFLDLRSWQFCCLSFLGFCCSLFCAFADFRAASTVASFAESSSLRRSCTSGIELIFLPSLIVETEQTAYAEEYI